MQKVRLFTPTNNERFCHVLNVFFLNSPRISTFLKFLFIFSPTHFYTYGINRAEINEDKL